MSEDLRLIAFCCQYCAYAAADLAGALRLQYPPDVRIVLLPCSGRLDLLTALLALEEGADGVMVVGCMPGDCHFLEGNLNARRRVEALQKLLQAIGLEAERVRMFNLSSAMAAEFAEAVRTMREQIAKLGPNPLRKVPQESEP
ncbi:MAG: hydrogenase iron-sulfur subunit [Anaerolineales bacterium]